MQWNGWPWALLFARWVLGLIFLMAGSWKVFELGAVEHARRYFLAGFSDSWIPTWLLWSLGVSIPFLELLAGLLVCAGWRLREATFVLGAILVVVTYGHLLQEPLFSIRDHILPRLALLLFVLAAPRHHDRWSLDAWMAREG